MPRDAVMFIKPLQHNKPIVLALFHFLWQHIMTKKNNIKEKGFILDYNSKSQFPEAGAGNNQLYLIHTQV